ncbi:OAM dimerization domain-containing protein [Peptostreptococcaceae bacterium AGR-M142]|jgi:beta-lysine 5,6-aminomutase beta subunit|nr:cobalamin-dependent protein [Peptostreptococcaceae bacterium]
MSGGLYSTECKDFDKTLDLTKIKPYGDTMNDGKVQLSFTLPLEDNEKSIEAAKQLGVKMGLNNVSVVDHMPLDKNFTFYVVYGNLSHDIDYTKIHVETVDVDTMDMHEVDDFIKENIKRKIVIVGASTGTDAHTVGIDAVMNMKGYAGHYGLERYDMIDAYNLGSQVENEEFIKKAIELNADVLLVSQTVTQKDIHIKNLTNLVELMEAEGIRDKVVLVCGGARISHELAKELGYDAGFGPGKYADDVASFAVNDIVDRKLIDVNLNSEVLN